VLLESALSTLRREGRSIGAVIPVDLFGRCADYDLLLPVCAAYDVPVVEDAAEALGAFYGDLPAGSFGVAAALSFNGNKIMTTSGGGMLLTSDAALAAHCRYLATQARQPVVHYEHTDIGYNYRLSNVLAALGRAQLSRLDEMISRRRALRDRYAKLFSSVDGVSLLGADDPGANCWLTTIVVDPAVAGWTASALGAWLTERDIETRPIWKPMHLQAVFSGCRSFASGEAQRLFEWGLALPSGSSLGPVAVDRVFEGISSFLALAGGSQ
jgi:dTDP-4-amino-4,6-dideoxygalactose transaminase